MNNTLYDEISTYLFLRYVGISHRYDNFNLNYYMFLIQPIYVYDLISHEKMLRERRRLKHITDNYIN